MEGLMEVFPCRYVVDYTLCENAIGIRLKSSPTTMRLLRMVLQSPAGGAQSSTAVEDHENENLYPPDGAYLPECLHAACRFSRSSFRQAIRTRQIGRAH